MIAFFDCETTGLDPNVDFLLEIGIILTDDELNILAKHSEVVVRGRPGTTDWVMLQLALDANDGFTRKMHEASGLLDDLYHGIPVSLAESAAIEFMRSHCIGGKPIMGGNSITHDRIFLRRWMPELLEEFHYRSLDVSGIREAARRWAPQFTELEPQPGTKHRVLDDLMDSIVLARHYRELFFNHA